MRKVFLSLAIIAGLTASAQLINVGAIEKVNLPAGVVAAQTAISPDGSFAVIHNNGGLSKVDLATGKTAMIAQSAAFLEVKISEDGSTIVYREPSYEGKLRYTTLKSVNMNNGKSTTIVAPTRNLQGFTLSNNNVAAVDNGKFTSKNIDGTAGALIPVASINKGALCVTVNGITNNISPQGAEGQSYLWPSISPDGKQVLYYLSGTGAFVCNIDGSNAVFVGNMRAPKWIDNSIVVGMDDRDNGENVTSSKLIAASADGKVKQDLTLDSSMAMYPSASADGSKLTFVTAGGELFVMSINK